MTHATWTDEQLSAFLDGELAPAEAEILARELEANPALAVRAERLSAANTAFITSVAQIDAAPVKASLKATMETPPAANVIQFPGRSVRAFLVEHRAIAASLLCMVAVGGLMSTMITDGAPDPLAPGPDGAILASSPLFRVLETTSTGEVVSVGGDATATPRLTFASAGGAFCRQFDLVKGDTASAAIACRKDGAWRTEVVAYGLARPSGDFQTASAARSPALEAFLDQRMAGPPLNAEEEAELLRDRWKPSRP